MPSPLKYFIIDFDSTFTQVEALDELCNISLRSHSEKTQRLKQIQHITQEAMQGNISFRESLTKRLAILEAYQEHLEELVTVLKQKISTSFERNKHAGFFELYRETIFIISNGFKEFIEPIVHDFGIKPSHVFANTFEFGKDGKIIGFDTNNPLSKSGGKVTVVKSLDLQGEIYVLGDGYNDFEIKKAGLTNQFYAFTENVKRDTVIEQADFEIQTLDDFLFLNNLPRAFSFPKQRINVLLLEGIHPQAQTYFEKEGYTVELLPHALDEHELSKKIKNISVLGLRSKTQVTHTVLQNANKLLTIGAFCIGTNQIDLSTCLYKGIPVFNAPYSNTRSVVELAIGQMIMLMRNIFDRSQEMHQGIWKKSASNSFELRGKKLGIIGYGNIGAQLSVLAESLGLQVFYYDIVEKLALGNARRCHTMQELLKTADIVTLHVDGRPDNRQIFGEQEFELMNEGAVFLNLSRGFTIDVAALRKYILNGKLRGAAVDVFPVEPKSNQQTFESDLCKLPNVILTPHIGGSTQEAQQNIGEFVPSKIIDYISTGNTFLSVNFPNLQLPILKNAHRLVHTHENRPGMLAKINHILAKYNVNIMGQYLKTNEHIGYVITDIDRVYDEALVKELKQIDFTIRFRLVY